MNMVWIPIIFLLLISLVTPVPILGYSVFTLLGLFIFSIYLREENDKCFEIGGDVAKGCGFPGEELFIRLELTNRSRLPVFWCALYQSFPVELGSVRAKTLVTLPARGKKSIQFYFTGIRRGIFNLPKVTLEYGDMFSLKENTVQFELEDEIIIYPEIAKIDGLKLRRHLPLGRHSVIFGLYDDTARLRGCRDYSPGDHPKMIHWPNMAKTGRLQTKEWETTLDADIGVFLNLNEEDYPVEAWSFLNERGIELAASITHHLAGERIGFFSNGTGHGRIPNTGQKADPRLSSQKSNGIKLLPKRGVSREKDILAYLAGVQLSNNLDFDRLLQEANRLTFGSVLIVITPQLNDSVIKEIKQLRFTGFHPVIVSPGRYRQTNYGAKLKKIGVPVFAGEKGGAGSRVFTLSPQN